MNALKVIKNLPILFAWIGFSALSQNSFAQKFYERNEYGIMGGATQYFGDLNPEYGFKSVQPAVGAFYRYYFNPYISLRTGLTYTHLAYKDSYSKNPYQQVRNLSFNNDIVEASVLGEFNFFYFMTGVEGRSMTPYMVLGVGAIYSDPYVWYNGRRQYLKGLGTEGQFMEEYKDRRYNKVNVIAPFGAGVKTWLAPGINFGFEVVHRFAFTDYLDDVSTNYVGENRFTNPNGTPTTASILQDPSKTSNGTKLGIAGKQRGDKASIDQFLMAQITLSFQLKTYRCPSDNPLWSQ
jgi:hypothetical protein